MNRCITDVIFGSVYRGTFGLGKDSVLQYNLDVALYGSVLDLLTAALGTQQSSA